MYDCELTNFSTLICNTALLIVFHMSSKTKVFLPQGGLTKPSQFQCTCSVDSGDCHSLFQEVIDASYLYCGFDNLGPLS